MPHSTCKRTQWTKRQMLVVSEEMHRVLADKADKAKVQEVMQMKSNKKDMEMALKWVERVQIQVRQVVVHITEIIKQRVENGEGSGEGGMGLGIFRWFFVTVSVTNLPMDKQIRSILFSLPFDLSPSLLIPPSRPLIPVLAP